jgi:hypothetical protein
VGSGGTDSIATSTDGITWTGRTGTTIFSLGRGAVYAKELWVAVGEGTTNHIATSPDGITWTGRGTNILSDFGSGVAFNS